MEQLVAFVERFNAEHGHTPSYSVIRRALGISDDGSVRRHVVEAEAAGLLHRGRYFGGNGATRVQRIRLGRPEEAQVIQIKMGRELVTKVASK